MRSRAAKIPLLRQPQVLPRGRGGGGLAESREDACRASGPAPLRSLALRRRADRSARPAAACARRARRHGLSPDRVRPGDEPALRPLRQRRSEPGREARCADRLDAGARQHASRSRDSTRRRRRRSPRLAQERPSTRLACSRAPGSARPRAVSTTASRSSAPRSIVTQLLYGGSGGQRNAIDPEATAGFDLRLVPGMTVADSRAAIEAHVRGQGYVLVDAPPTRGRADLPTRDSRDSIGATTATRPRCHRQMIRASPASWR